MKKFLARLVLFPAGLLAAAGLLSSCGGDAEPSPAATQDITFTAPGKQTLGSAPAALLASASSGLAVNFVSNSSGVCSVNGTALNLLAAGTCTLSAGQAGNSRFAAAATVTLSFDVAQGSQTITFVSPGNQVFSAAPINLVANASSGLGVVFASSTPAVCAVGAGPNGSAFTLLALGSCTVTASQPGNATYAAAPAVANTFTVAAAMQAQTIAFSTLANQTLGAAPLPLVATASSGLAVAFASSTTSLCTVNGSTLTLLGAGTCTVVASQAGDFVYAGAPAVSNSLQIATIAQTIAFTQPGSQRLGTAPALLVATASSGLAVTIASSTPTVCTVSGTNLTLLTVGTCTLNANQPGSPRFAAAAQVSQSFPVAAALIAQTIVFAQPGNQVLGSTPAALVASSTSGLAVALASSTPAVCAVNGSALTLTAAGTCSITASQAGNSVYAAALPVVNSFSVTAALLAQSIAFTAPGDQRLGTPAAALVATATSGLAVTVASNTPAVCTVSGNSLNLLAVGACSLTANQPGNATYAAAAPVTVAFAVVATSLAQSIAFTSPGNQALGAGPLNLLATSTSGLPVAIASTTPSVCRNSGTVLTLLAAGTCTLSASQAGDAVYAAAPPVAVSFLISVALSVQTISFAPPGNQRLGVAPAPLVATASSGLAVAFASTTPAQCGTGGPGGNTLILLAAGSCSISASQPGNNSFAAAPVVVQSFQINPALLPQTITFAPPGAQTLGTPPGPLAATSSSGLTVSFVSTTPGVCSASGTTLTLVAAGTCSITAGQAGNTTFAAAAPVTSTFSVAAGPVAQSITFFSPGTQTLGTAPATLNATASSGLTVSVASSTSAVCTVSGTTLNLVSAGTCILTATQGGNATFAAAAAVTLSFVVNAAPVAAVELMANGGFETAPGGGQIAFGWRGANSVPATLSTNARSGSRSAAMAVPDPGFGGSGLVQNAVDDGGRPSILGLYVGKTTSLTFWAKGNASITGNLVFSLRYLDAGGNILNTVVNNNFGAQINANTWSLISLNGPPLPANTSAIFLEMTLAVGPTGVTTNPDGSVTNYGQALVFIDDVSVTVQP